MLLAWQVRWLLGHGLDVGARDSGGATPLHQAAAHLARPIMQALLAAGADVNAEDAEARLAAALCAACPGGKLADASPPHASPCRQTHVIMSCPCTVGESSYSCRCWPFSYVFWSVMLSSLHVGSLHVG